MTRDEKYRKTQKRNRAYRTRRALRLIRRGQPKTLLETHELGLHCVHAGTGAFRITYRIQGTSLLIKFPIMFDYPDPETRHDNEGKNHTRMEVKKILSLREHPIMRKHLPPVYYFNGGDGVMVTKYYPKSKWVPGAMSIIITEMIKKYCGVNLGDLSPDNVRAEFSNLIFIDLGY